MSRISAPRPLMLSGLVVLLIVNAMVFGGRLTAWVADITASVLTPVTGTMVRLRALFMVAAGKDDFSAQHLALEDEILRLQSQLANQEELKREIAFLQGAAGIRERTGKEPIKAGIFSYPQVGGIRQVVMNRGRADWVMAGDVVVTPSGALVGAVSRIFEHHSIVTTIGDVGLDVTVRIMGTEVSGLLRATADGVVVDLIQKNETVSENALVVTSGDDLYPAGLIVGTVRSVDNNATTLFKIVRVTPATATDVSGDVIVIRP